MFLAWGTCGGMEGRAGERKTGRREDYIRGKERKKEGGCSGRRGGPRKKGKKEGAEWRRREREGGGRMRGR